MENWNISETILVMATMAFVLIVYAYMFAKKPIINVKNRSVNNLTDDERYSSHPISYTRNDVDRFGRWKVWYVNGESTTRIGKLSDVVVDVHYKHSAIFSYREIR